MKNISNILNSTDFVHAYVTCFFHIMFLYAQLYYWFVKQFETRGQAIQALRKLRRNGIDKFGDFKQ